MFAINLNIFFIWIAKREEGRNGWEGKENNEDNYDSIVHRKWENDATFVTLFHVDFTFHLS